MKVCSKVSLILGHFEKICGVILCEHQQTGQTQEVVVQYNKTARTKRCIGLKVQGSVDF